MNTKRGVCALRVAIAATLILGCNTGFAQNILTNGSFEEGFFSGVGGVMALGDGSTYIDEWQVVGGTSGGIQWLTSNNIEGFLPADGLKFLNLAGTPAGADSAGIQLALPVAVVKGQYYDLTFDLGTTFQDHRLYTDPAGLSGPGVQVTISGSSGASQGGYFFFGDTSLPNNDGNNRWTPENTGAFEATGYWLSISFSSVGYGGETFIGLDNVSLVPVPEPSTVVLMTLGSCCGVFARWRTLRPDILKIPP